MHMRSVWMILLSRLLIIILDWGVGFIFACLGLSLVCALISLFILFGCIHVLFLYICPYVHTCMPQESMVYYYSIKLLAHINESNLR